MTQEEYEREIKKLQLERIVITLVLIFVFLAFLVGIILLIYSDYEKKNRLEEFCQDEGFSSFEGLAGDYRCLKIEDQRVSYSDNLIYLNEEWYFVK